jgi:ABC-type molybdate transport system substrate-binding protein
MRALQQGDIYLATAQDVERMAQDGLILESHPLASLTPAIIVRKGDNTVASWDDLAKDGVRIAIITPELGVAGVIAKKIIGKSPLNDSIQANITNLSATPSEMVQLLLNNEVDALIIWDSVAKSNPKLAAIEIPAEIVEILEMWIAVPTYTASEQDASALVEFIAGAEGRQALENAGFSVLEK